MSKLHILRADSNTRFRPVFEVDGIKLSVQGGSGNYCSPKVNFTALDDYDSFEVAIYKVYVGDIDISIVFPSVYKLLEPFAEYGNTGNFAYVPKDVVEQVVYELEKLL